MCRITLRTVSQEAYQFSLNRLASKSPGVTFPLHETVSNQIMNQDVFHQGTHFPQAEALLAGTMGV